MQLLLLYKKKNHWKITNKKNIKKQVNNKYCHGFKKMESKV